MSDYYITLKEDDDEDDTLVVEYSSDNKNWSKTPPNMKVGDKVEFTDTDGSDWDEVIFNTQNNPFGWPNGKRQVKKGDTTKYPIQSGTKAGSYTFGITPDGDPDPEGDIIVIDP